MGLLPATYFLLGVLQYEKIKTKTGQWVCNFVLKQPKFFNWTKITISEYALSLIMVITYTLANKKRESFCLLLTSCQLQQV